MSHESNWAGQQGAQNPNHSAEQHKKAGMSDTQAAEAAAAGQRAREAQQQQQQKS